jgi:uncharacterized protein (TIGR04255 family)
MNRPHPFTINLEEEFPPLEHAPSIEAMMYWRTPVGKELDQNILKDELVRRFPDYPFCQPQHSIEIAASSSLDGTSSEVNHQVQPNGFRLQDAQSHRVAQFTPTGVVFSRLQPYEGWDKFQEEAIKFWNVFIELAAPTSIQLLGVRYINLIPMRNGESASTYLNSLPPPLPDLNLQTDSFFYQDTYQIPGYYINWVRTVQSQPDSPGSEQSLIVDINVYTTEVTNLDREYLIKLLDEMRWIKNKIFFSCITQTAHQQFGT